MRRAFVFLAGSSILTACASVGGAGGGAIAPDGGASGFSADPVFRKADIAGKTATDIDRLLGAPDLTRIEGNGEFRRYALVGCTLMVILYPDENGTKRAASLSAGVLKSGEEKPDLDLCLARGKEKVR